MLELAKELKVKKYIYASSSSVYGGNKFSPFQLKIELITLYHYAASKNQLSLSQNITLLIQDKINWFKVFTVYG